MINLRDGMVPCEGSGWWPTNGVCQMCGRIMPTEHGIVVRHERDDVPPNDGSRP